VIPSAVLATDKERLEVEQIGRASVAAAKAGTIATGNQTLLANRLSATSFAVAQPAEPLSAEVRAKAPAAVDEDRRGDRRGQGQLRVRGDQLASDARHAGAGLPG
jgi:hypothetical protein